MLTEKEIIVGSMIYIMLQSIDPREPAGKRARKAISRAIKKELAIFVETHKEKERYLVLVNKGYDLVFKARDELKEDDLRADPGVIIDTLINRWPEMIQGFNLDAKRVTDLKDAYCNSKLQFMSAKYANRMAKVVSEFLEGEKKNGKDIYSGRISIHKDKRKLNIGK